MFSKIDSTVSVISSFRDKSVLITGATGFLGKVLLEKLLRDVVDVKNVFILIRGKRGKTFEERFELLKSSPAFVRVQKENSKVFSKLIPIEADINDSKLLGISEYSLQILRTEVSFIFHLAATVKFTEPLEVAIRTNVIATKNLLAIAQTFEKLEAFVYVSTAFSNVHVKKIREIIYESEFSWKEAVQAVEENNQDKLKSFKWQCSFPNTYTFSKHLAEKLISEKSSDLPLVIVRPSIVTPAISEPFPGWIDFQGTLMAFHICVFYGVLRCFIGIPDFIFSIVPCDYVSTAAIVSAAEMSKNRTNCLKIYNFTPSWGKRQHLELMDSCIINAREACPSEKVMFYPNCINKITFCSFVIHFYIFQKLPALVIDILMWPWTKNFKLSKTSQMIFRYMIDCEYFVTQQLEFDDSECQTLLRSISKNESSTFGCEIGKIDTKEYDKNFGLGIRRYLMMETDATIPAARIRIKKLYFIQRIINVAFYAAVLYFLLNKIVSNWIF